MNKQSDFGNDLAILNENVNAEVGDVLSALQQKRTASRSPLIVKDPPQPKSQPESPPTGGATQEPLATTGAPRRQRLASRSRLTPTVEHAEPLENVTTRLRQKTNELLTEAALRQRLKKEDPSTRQDIVEAALQDWFRRHGYALSRVDDGD
jgi:hypothetical protein